MALDELHKAKVAIAQLATCIVQTMNETDPTFQERFLARMEEAYYKARDDSEGDQRHAFEMFSWTREFLTGFSILAGPGDPMLKDYDPNRR